MEGHPLPNLVQDLKAYHSSKQLPDHLQKLLTFSKEVKEKLFDLMSKELMKEQTGDNVSPEERSKFVFRLLHETNVDDVEVLLKYYDLPLPYSLRSSLKVFFGSPIAGPPMFRFKTLPVNMIHIGDGDGFTCYAAVTDFVNVPESITRTMEQYQTAQLEPKEAKTKIQMVDSSYSLRNCEDVIERGILCRKYSIRLRGIDAPEMNQPYGKEAREFLRKVISDNELEVLVCNIDPHLRYVADVYLGDILIQDLLLGCGAAWQHIYFDTGDRFRELQESARESRIGLWDSEEPPIPPWEWKQGKRSMNEN